MCSQRRVGSLTQEPPDQLVAVFRGERADAILRQRHGHLAPMCFAADPQFAFEHGRCTRYVAIALGNLLKRRREEGRVAGMAEHAMLLINKRGGLGLGERCVICYQQQRKQARGKKARLRGIHDIHSTRGSRVSLW